jgi:hypothetical protein
MGWRAPDPALGEGEGYVKVHAAPGVVGAVYFMPEPTEIGGVVIGADFPCELIAEIENVYDLPFIRFGTTANVSVAVAITLSFVWLAEGLGADIAKPDSILQRIIYSIYGTYIPQIIYEPVYAYFMLMRSVNRNICDLISYNSQSSCFRGKIPMDTYRTICRSDENAGR